jgi:hypothetical protein
MSNDFRKKRDNEYANKVVIDSLFTCLKNQEALWSKYNQHSRDMLKKIFDTINALDRIYTDDTDARINIIVKTKEAYIEKQKLFIKDLQDVLLMEQLDLDRNENKFRVYSKATENPDNFLSFVAINSKYLDIIIEDLYKNRLDYGIDQFELMFLIRQIEAPELERIPNTKKVLIDIIEDLISTLKPDLMDKAVDLIDGHVCFFQDTKNILERLLFLTQENDHLFAYQNCVKKARRILRTYRMNEEVDNSNNGEI